MFYYRFARLYNAVSRASNIQTNEHLNEYIKTVVIPCANANRMVFLPYPKNDVYVSKNDYSCDFANYVMKNRLINNKDKYELIYYKTFFEKILK